MSCGLFDDADIISVYTREQAITDGILIPYQFTYKREKTDCCFSRGLWEKHCHSPSQLREICRKGMQLMELYDEEDDGNRKLRVISKSRIWVIFDGDGITFLRPEDY